MAQSTDDRARSNGGKPPGILRLTVPEAAQALGISPEAVRNRLSRKTLNSTKEDGTVYVLLDADRLHHIDDRSGSVSDDIPKDSASLVAAKDETIRILSEQLEAERTASAELRRIVAGLVQRVPELEASPESRESSVTASEPEGDSDEESQVEKRRSWLHRFFFGPG